MKQPRERLTLLQLEDEGDYLRSVCEGGGKSQRSRPSYPSERAKKRRDNLQDRNLRSGKPTLLMITHNKEVKEQEINIDWKRMNANNTMLIHV